MAEVSGNKILIRDASGKFRNPSTDEGKQAIDNLLEEYYESSMTSKRCREDIEGLLGTLTRGKNDQTGEPTKTLHITGKTWDSTITFDDKTEIEIPDGVKKGHAMVRIAEALEASEFGQYVSWTVEIKPKIFKAAKDNVGLALILEFIKATCGESKTIGTPVKKVVK